MTKRGKHMAVKTFAVEDDDSPRDLDALPFEPFEASPSLDVWSLCCMLLRCAGETSEREIRASNVEEERAGDERHKCEQRKRFERVPL